MWVEKQLISGGFYVHMFLSVLDPLIQICGQNGSDLFVSLR